MSVRVEDMSVARTAIDGLLLITTKTVTDDRGTVREFFRTSGFGEHEVPVPERWAQVNLTRTVRGGLRGLHGENADKLIGLAAGEAFGAWVDARPGSATRGAVVTAELRVGTQLFVPAGVCNGFQAVTDCEYLYCFGVEWTPGMAGVAVNPLDPALGIAWPLTGDDALVSAKDAAAPMFAEL
ncbi:dTDP-4-dehydrorhamnose 3,5-epimerase [Jatrophihabitans endophyticus]|uniref:dTDP-4-dehydrorhamnose 3,5-epimerase n=1 Tax=Jatrophihabitans endophyticus TaxID=1206085 RepID=A0A1M5U698_9ACTN|nr:dTDP-4-dehydrorhamnose 3,5-epimerase [Jatrophihabitans endophyticus]SHH58484.1 dTDP-4-dehydrorhamnose 3,5-epimerase [Jatrophihabitans endophyticus]